MGNGFIPINFLLVYMFEDTVINLLSGDKAVIMERIGRILNNYDEIYSISLLVSGNASGGENEILECD